MAKKFAWSMVAVQSTAVAGVTLLSVLNASAAVLNGQITSVDIDRDQATIQPATGAAVVVDLQSAAIHGSGGTLRVDDISAGMSARAQGDFIDRQTFVADAVDVNVSQAPIPERRPVAPRSSATHSGRGPVEHVGDHVTLRGTVEAVDDDRGTFDVRVDSHQRRIGITPQTYFVDIDTGDGQHVPVKAGDRVSVTGVVRPGNILEASSIALARIVEDVEGGRQGQLTGRVSRRSDKWGSRDIHLEIENGRDLTVHVPRGIPIRREGRPVSVHDLGTDDVVEVRGKYADGAYVADSITIVGRANTDSGGD